MYLFKILCRFIIVSVLGMHAKADNEKTAIEKLSDQMQEMMKLVEQQNSQMRAEMEEQRRLWKDLSERVLIMEHNAEAVKAHNENPVDAIYGSFACVTDLIHIACPNNRTIRLNDAYYGQYAKTCPEATCCAPNPINDCLERVEDNAPQDWLAMTVACDNKTECEFQVPGGLVLTCVDPYDIHYMNVNYSCLPEVVPSPGAFTVALGASTVLDTDDILVFDNIVTNIGPHFSADTSAFLCPYTGIYSFFLTVTDDDGAYLRGELMIENKFIVRCRTNNDEFAEQTSNMAVVECQRGQRVWVRVGDEGIFRAAGETTFSGFLIHVYDE